MKNNRPGIIGSILRNLVFLLNICAAGWLGLCAAAAVISPLEMRYLALFSLTTPFAIATNIFFIIFWLFSLARFRALLSLLTMVACHQVVLTIFGFNFFGENDITPSGPAEVKVISWNVHGMGIFNTPRSKQFEADIIYFLENEDADILCLPEYYTPRDNILKPHSQYILKNNKYKEYRFNIDNDLGPESYLGTAFFSRYPVKNYVAHQLSQYIYMLQSDVLLPDSVVVRMFFVHLNTFGLSDNDKAYIEELKRRRKDIDSSIDRSRTFVHKFTQAFVNRSEEADRADSIIRQSPYPVLICGDFNDLPGSYTYTRFRGKKLKDAFVEKGRGLGRTYNLISPTLRIDYIFYDPTALRIRGYSCPHTHLSDHNPVIANFEIIGAPVR